MGNHVVRLYALAVALVVFFLSWAVIAARPWRDEPAASADPRLARLAEREAELRQEAARAQQILERRSAAYEDALAARQAENRTIRAANAALAQPPRISVLPPSIQPVTVTRSS